MMKLKLVFLLCCVGNMSANTLFSQQTTFNVEFENQTLIAVLNDLKARTGYNFTYNRVTVNESARVTVNLKDATLEQILDKVLSSTGYSYEIDEKVVYIMTAQQPQQAQQRVRILSGRVVGDTGNPIVGVTVLLKGTQIGVPTDDKGDFRLSVPQLDNTVLVFSFIGYETQEVRIRDDKPIRVVLKETSTHVGEVVVTGYGDIDKGRYTGSSTTIKGDELRSVSSGNLLNSLQLFDPSFRIVQNDRMGSDPNTLPEFYIRGRSGVPNVKELDAIESGSNASRYALVNNPNLPVFIMDGFEVSAEKIYDLDINRIETVTILKDAAATAIYGSRASNGVIVIETRAPGIGKIRVNYSGNFGVTAPDLSSYDMMNSKEALAAEVAAGYFEVRPDELAQGNTYEWYKMLHDWRYQQKQNLILKGVDNYWMAQPLRTEFKQKHSVYVEGGVEELRFGVDMNYDKDNGVMKGSNRDRKGAGLTFMYRHKGLSINNQVSFQHVGSNVSPYGSFANYSRRHPYDEYKNADGNYNRLLDMWGNIGSYTTNPLYEAHLGSYNKSYSKDWTNNLNVNWVISDNIIVRGRLAVWDKTSGSDVFTDPNSAIYSISGTNWFDKGKKSVSRTETTGWDTNITISFNKKMGVHHPHLQLGVNVKNDKSHREDAHYTGFPDAERHQVAYAYKIDNKPAVQDNHTRMIGTFGTLNYSINDIYLFDASIRVDGSSEFGTKKRWAPFWAIGMGLNLHKYEIINKQEFIDQWKVRASHGQTGKLNVSPYVARNIYELMLDQWYPTGIGGRLQAMGNPNLTWEKQRSWNVGMDLNLFNYRVYLSVNWYNNITRDMISSIPLPASSGFGSYTNNVGKVRNRGLDLIMELNVYRSSDFDITLSGNIAHNSNKIMEISQSLKDYNDRVDEFYAKYRYNSSQGLLNMLGSVDLNLQYAQPVMKFEEGNSLSSVYGMESLGINPANGREVFVKRDGTITYTWSAMETQKIGDTDPKLNGTFMLKARYKDISLFASFTYRLGGDKYNQTLVDNVENVNLWKYNADRRVMQDRWQNPGDITQLKSIKDRYEVTRPTSRFLQKDNTLHFSSLNVSYDFTRPFARALSTVGLKNLRLAFMMEDVFQISSIKKELGLDYPFARTFTLVLNATF